MLSWSFSPSKGVLRVSKSFRNYVTPVEFRSEMEASAAVVFSPMTTSDGTWMTWEVGGDGLDTVTGRGDGEGMSTAASADTAACMQAPATPTLMQVAGVALSTG